MNFMGAETVYNHADYRLMSRRALDALEDFKEVNLFLKICNNRLTIFNTFRIIKCGKGQNAFIFRNLIRRNG